MSNDLWQRSWTSQKERLKGRRYQKLLPQLDSDLSSFQACIKQLSDQYGSKNIAKQLMAFEPYLTHLDSFSKCISTVVPSNSQVSSLIWGGTQILIVCATKFIRLLETISTMLCGLARPLARMQNALQYYPTNNKLQEPLRGLYNEYTSFCIDTVIFLKKWPLYNLVRMSWSVVDQSFEKSKKKMDEYAEEFLAEWNDLYRQELLQGARHLRRVLPQTDIAPKSAKTVFGSVGPKNFYFTGRTDALNDMISHLCDQHPSTLLCCIIHGIGGLGKTQTAIEFAYQARSHFHNVFWLQASSGPELAKSFALIAQDKLPQDIAQLQDQSRVIEMVRRWLNETDQRCLIIFDNAENMRTLLSYWPSNPQVSVIVTTQKSEFLHISSNKGRLVIRLRPLSKQEGATLLFKFLQSHPDYRQYGWDDSHNQEAETISNMVAGLPIGVAHIAGYITQAQLTLTDFVNMIRTRRHTLRIWESDQPTYARDYGKTLGAVHDLALSELNDSSKTLLFTMTFFNPTKIGRNFLLQKPNNSKLHGASPQDTEFSFVEAMRGLLARRLVEQNASGEGGAKTIYSLHQSLQINILHRLDTDLPSRQKFFENVLDIIQNIIPERSKIYLPAPEHWELLDECLPHILSLYTIFEGSDPPISGSFEFANLLQKAGQYMWERSMALEGPKILQAAEKILDDINFPVNDPFRADLYTPIGLMMHFNGITFRSQGIEYLRKALEVRERMLPITEEATAISNNIVSAKSYEKEGPLIYWIAKMDLGWALLQSERFEEASVIYQHCFRWYKSQSEVEEELPFQYAKYYHNNSYVLMSRGRHADAIKAAKRALDLCGTSISPTSQHGFMYRFTLGCHYLISGHIAEALQIHNDILHDREKVLGSTNPDTLDSQYMVAIIHEKLNEESQAISLLRSALSLADIAKWAPEHVARAKYRLSRLILAEDASQSKTLEDESLRFLAELRPLIPAEVLKKVPNCNREQAVRRVNKERETRENKENENLVLFDYVSSIWAGRTTGALSTCVEDGKMGI